MSEEVTIRTTDVTECLKFIIGMSLTAYSVDDAGYVIDHEGTRITLQDEHPIILYQEKINDPQAIILNPFSEGIKENDANNWLYRVLRVALTSRILNVMQIIVEYAAEEQRQVSMSAAEKKKAGVKPAKIPPILAHLVSVIVNDIDTKTATEMAPFRKYANNPQTSNGLLYLLYMKRMLTTRLGIGLIEEFDEYEVPRDVRKGTLAPLRKLLMTILNIKKPEDLAKFTAAAEEGASTKIDSQMRCLFNIYKQINPILDAVDQSYSIDLSEFKRHLDQMPAYSKNARALISVMPPSERPQTTAQSLPTVQSLPLQRSALPQRIKTGMPAYMLADGTVGPELEIDAGPSNTYYGPPLPMQPQYQQQQYQQQHPLFPPQPMMYGGDPRFAGPPGTQAPQSIYNTPPPMRQPTYHVPDYRYAPSGGVPSGLHR